MPRVRMLRHGPSRGARELRRALGVKAVRFVRTKFRPRPGDVVLNWGCAEDPFPGAGVQWINNPASVARAQNKLLAYQDFLRAGVPHPTFTEDSAEAAQWLRDGRDVVVRRLLRGSAGRGIVLKTAAEWNNDMGYGVELPNAPLYTQYVKKADEYRVHVVNGTVIDIQQKRRRHGQDAVCNQIRNASNGWVYCRQEIECPDVVTEAAIAAVNCLGLTFGAADIGYNRYHQAATVYEVNTAPGLEGSTIESYRAHLSVLLPARDAHMRRRLPLERGNAGLR